MAAEVIAERACAEPPHRAGHGETAIRRDRWAHRDVCLAHLTQEYATVALELAATLARKRPSPLLRGHGRTWTCGITYTIGTVNFLFDPTQQPHVRAQ